MGSPGDATVTAGTLPVVAGIGDARRCPAGRGGDPGVIRPRFNTGDEVSAGRLADIPPVGPRSVLLTRRTPCREVARRRVDRRAGLLERSARPCRDPAPPRRGPRSVRAVSNELQVRVADPAPVEPSAEGPAPRRILNSQATTVLFALTAFLGAALLFVVQPMVTRFVLPRFGGSATVWSTSSLFFQVVLLLGYVYVHVATNRLRRRAQIWVHLVVLLVPLLALPVAAPAMGGEGGYPAIRLLAHPHGDDRAAVRGAVDDGAAGPALVLVDAGRPQRRPVLPLRGEQPRQLRGPARVPAGHRAGADAGPAAHRVVSGVRRAARARRGVRGRGRPLARPRVRRRGGTRRSRARRCPAARPPRPAHLAAGWRSCRRRCCSPSRRTCPPTSRPSRCCGSCRSRSTSRPSSSPSRGPPGR